MYIQLYNVHAYMYKSLCKVHSKVPDPLIEPARILRLSKLERYKIFYISMHELLQNFVK